jgi:hypothetical protein
VIVSVSVQLQPADTAPPAVDYRWDADTDILTARLRDARGKAGMSGSVELEGADGSWLILDVASGSIDGVEVAVWPDVQKRRALAPPAAEDARVVVPSTGKSSGPVSSLEVEVRLLAESDDAERVIHFRVGAQRDVRTVRVGRDLLLDVDPQSRIAGVWLLNVPPFPDT